MKKSLLKALAVVLAVTFAVALAACSKGIDPAEGLTLQNDLDVEIVGFYISSETENSWGEHVNESPIAAGKSQVLGADALPDDTGTYDVGALDANSMVYEFYRVPLEVGEKLTIFAGDDGHPVLVITDEYGNDTAIDGYIYQYEG